MNNIKKEKQQQSSNNTSGRAELRVGVHKNVLC